MTLYIARMATEREASLRNGLMAETGASSSTGPESTSMPLKRSRGRLRKDAQTQKVTDEVQGSRKDRANYYTCVESERGFYLLSVVD